MFFAGSTRPRFQLRELASASKPARELLEAMSRPPQQRLSVVEAARHEWLHVRAHAHAHAHGHVRAERDVGTHI